MKTAFVFPGQGSQYVGMGRDFYDKYSESCKIFELAEQVTGIDIANICFKENDRINQTEYTQIAMLTTELAILEAIKNKGHRYDVTAGLSLGEYAALVASNALSVKDALSIVRRRGILMQNAYPSGGAMCAIMNFPSDKIRDNCMLVRGVVSIANYNSPKQIVISGEEQAVKDVLNMCKDQGAKRFAMLNVSGPFHSELLRPAADKLGEVLSEISLSEIDIPYVCNVDAEYVTDKNAIKGLLVEQICSSVKWLQSVEKMIEDGVNKFVEIGPGHVLTGLIGKINKDVEVFNIETVEDLEMYL